MTFYEGWRDHWTWLFPLSIHSKLLHGWSVILLEDILLEMWLVGSFLCKYHTIELFASWACEPELVYNDPKEVTQDLLYNLYPYLNGYDTYAI